MVRDMNWIRFNQASWHIASGVSRTTGKTITLCGKQCDGPAQASFPFREKTCESCARLQLKKESENG